MKHLPFLFAALFAVPVSAQEPPLALQTIEAALPKVVKLYGAGGFKGLEGYGTGFLVTADGHVATSWGPLLDADPVTVVLDDGRRYPAKLVGADPNLGVAVLKFESSGGLPYFDLNAATEAAPGDRMLAFSNMFRVAAGDEPVSVMHGNVLATAPLAARRGRLGVRLDAPVYFLDAVTNNPGAAGGIVTTLDGAPLGMIGRELQGEATETWINYAIPATEFRDRVAGLIAGRVEDRTPGPAAEQAQRRLIEFGLVMVPDVVARTPTFVTEVLPNSPAATAGVQRDDLVLFVAGEPVRSIAEFRSALSRAEPGDLIDLIVRRAGRLETLSLDVPKRAGG